MHLFLSPHLDDAALSCGGTIHHLAHQGQRVMVVNVMAGDPPDPLPQSPLIRELHERWKTGENPVAERRDEDRAAMQILGAEVAFLDIPDCVYRTAADVVLYPHGDADIFGEVSPEDPAANALSQVSLPVEMPDVTHLYAPLAAGHHVDHQLVRDWGWGLVKGYPQVALHFYEDYPYGETPGAVQKAVTLCPVTVAPVTQTLTAADYAAKVQAIAAYDSQISTFWKDTEQMKARVHQYMRDATSGEWVERFWRGGP